MEYKGFSMLILTAFLITACKNAAELREEVAAGQGPSTFSLGKVQCTIREGMAQEQVIASLGSPNIVTNDDQGHETWVYDKIATEGAYSTSAGGFIFWGNRAGAYETTQKTLTVLLKFDAQKRVKSINYHQSKF